MERRDRDIIITALEILKGDIAKDNRTDFNVREINRLEKEIENAAQIDIVPGFEPGIKKNMSRIPTSVRSANSEASSSRVL